MFYIYSVPVGYTTLQNCGPKPCYNKLGPKFPKIHSRSGSCTPQCPLIVALFDTLKNSCCSSSKLGKFSEATDLFSNKPLTLTCGPSLSHLYWYSVPSVSHWPLWWTGWIHPWALLGLYLSGWRILSLCWRALCCQELLGRSQLQFA